MRYSDLREDELKTRELLTLMEEPDSGFVSTSSLGTFWLWLWFWFISITIGMVFNNAGDKTAPKLFTKIQKLV